MDWKSKTRETWTENQGGNNKAMGPDGLQKVKHSFYVLLYFNADNIGTYNFVICVFCDCNFLWYTR